MHIRFLVHVCPHYQIRIFIPPHPYVRSPFCVFFHICGHDESDPYGCLRSAKMLLMGWNFVVVYVSANTIKLYTNVHLQLAMAQQHTQNAYFRIAKTILLQCKNPLFARQKPYFCTAKRGFLQCKNRVFYNALILSWLLNYIFFLSTRHKMAN